MSNSCNRILLSAEMVLPGEAEAGSAGKQPAKEYPGLRCANGASGPGGGHSARVVSHWTSEPCLVNPYYISRSGFPPPKLRMNRKTLNERRIVGCHWLCQCALGCAFHRRQAELVSVTNLRRPAGPEGVAAVWAESLALIQFIRSPRSHSSQCRTVWHWQSQWHPNFQHLVSGG